MLYPNVEFVEPPCSIAYHRISYRWMMLNSFTSDLTYIHSKYVFEFTGLDNFASEFRPSIKENRQGLLPVRQVFPSDCSGSPSGHAHRYPPGVKRHKWLQPPLLTLHNWLPTRQAANDQGSAFLACFSSLFYSVQVNFLKGAKVKMEDYEFEFKVEVTSPLV